jgi:hypothetical protein
VWLQLIGLIVADLLVISQRFAFLDARDKGPLKQVAN